MSVSRLFSLLDHDNAPARSNGQAFSVSLTLRCPRYSIVRNIPYSE